MKFTNSPYLYLSIALTLCCLAFGLLPQISSSAVRLAPAKSATEPTVVTGVPTYEVEAAVAPAYDDDPIFKVVDRMPLFPGCDDEGEYAKRKNCADKKLLTYVYDNIKYPKEARENNVEGMAVISFIIERDGRVTNASVMRDPGAGTGTEALRVVDQMRKDDIYWTPGRHKGKPVRVKFHLPVKFKLESEEEGFRIVK